MNYFTIIIVSILLFTIPITAMAESILITKTTLLKDEIIFDGIWTHQTEWKASSLKEIDTDDGSIYIRHAHQDDFVYIFIDAVADKRPEKNSDKAMVCFDTKNDKTLLPNLDDYCFIAVLGKSFGFTLQGGSFVSPQNYFKKITNHDDFIAIGGVSNENDRYSTIPHSSYEFRIPVDVINRTNVYGFYVGVFDQSKGKLDSWPESSSYGYKIPSPSTWGELVSPDNSLPEFPLPTISVLVGLIMILFLVNLNKNRFQFFTIK